MSTKAVASLLSLMARPVAAFTVLLPMVYAAAAITAHSTDALVVLIVAIGAAGVRRVRRDCTADSCRCSRRGSPHATPDSRTRGGCRLPSLR